MVQEGGIFVTGATGFVGRRLIASLLHDRNTIYALSREDRVERDGRIRLIKGDLAEKIELPPDISTIFHCAGFWSDSDAPSVKEQMEKINIRGTEKIVEAALERKCRLIHLGTAAVVGDTKEVCVDEKTVCHPRNAYEESKYEGEKIVGAAVQKGLKAQILRPTFIFGPGRAPADDPFLQLVIAIYRGRYKNICKGRGIYNIVHIDEVVSALRCLNNDVLPNGGLFFINTPISFNEFSQTVRFATTGKRSEAGNIPYPAALVAASLFTGITAITGRRMPLSLTRLRTLTNKKVYLQDRLISTTGYKPLCSVEEHIVGVCREYGEGGFFN